MIAKGAIMATMVANPEVGIPLAISYITGVPVLPAPQAMAGPLVEGGVEVTEGATASMNGGATGGTDVTSGTAVSSGTFSLESAPESQLMQDVAPSTNSPTEAYNRTMHYGKTPTAADRNALGATAGTDVDHGIPLVQHYYEGDGQGGKRDF